MTMKPELVVDCGCHIGENPLWHSLEKCLYWTDITRGRLYRYDPGTDRYISFYIGIPVGGFTIQADGALLLFMTAGAVAKWDGRRMEYILPYISSERNTRFNDVIADPEGRVFCGTMPVGSRPGRLYRLDPDGSLHLVLKRIGRPNGMGFTPNHRAFYCTDSLARCIYRFDYDAGTGKLSNRRIWLQVSEGTGNPDGLTVDSQEGVWSARWNGAALYHYTPDGIETSQITFPAQKVTSAAFGGTDLSDLYITTAQTDGLRIHEGAGAGALFRLRPGVLGLPECFSRIKCP